MLIKKISICVFACLFCLGLAGAVFAADFDHSMKFTGEEIDAASSMVSPTYAAANATDPGDSMTFTSEEIDAVSSTVSPTYAVANPADLGGSMTFTSEEINAIGLASRIVICTENC